MVTKARQYTVGWILTGLIAATLAACGDGSIAAPNDASGTRAQGLAPECDVDGTWALQFVVPVKWTGSAAIKGGEGKIVQWAKSHRHRAGGDVTDELVACGNQVPDYEGGLFAERYGVAFPDSLFDGDFLPATQVSVAMAGFTVGSSFTSSAAAIELGVHLDDPAADPWPGPGRWMDLKRHLVDTDRDGKPGVTVYAKTGDGYTAPPTGWGRKVRAEAFYTAARNVASVKGVLTQCDKLTGEVTIPLIGGKAAINSHVLGCRKNNKSECSTGDTSLIDGFQPVYTVTDQPKVTMVKLADDATCGDVRKTEF